MFEYVTTLPGMRVNRSPWKVDERIPWDAPNEFRQPPVGGEIEFGSLLTHVGRAFNTKTIPENTIAAALQHCEALYEDARWEIPEDFLSDDHITRAINQLKSPSSPGYPLGREYATNKDFLEKEAELSLPGTYSHLIQSVRVRLDQYRSDPNYHGDPSRFFVKQEPHKVEKLDDGRIRLIFSLAVIDQIIDICLFGPSIEARVKAHRTLPTKVGMSFYNGGIDRMFRYMQDNGKKEYASTDFKFWDWSVAMILYLVDLRFRRRMCNNVNSPHYEDWLNLATARNNATMQGEVITSDGRLYRQLVAGIVRSGGLRTIDMNSFCMVFLRACFEVENYPNDVKLRLVAMGDDTDQHFPRRDHLLFSEWCHLHGYNLKVSDELVKLIDTEFCSHTFKQVGQHIVPCPTNWNKHAYALKRNSTGGRFLIPTLFSLMIEYAFVDDKFDILSDLLRQHADPSERATFSRSREFFQTLVTGTFEGSPCEITEDDIALADRCFRVFESLFD